MDSKKLKHAILYALVGVIIFFILIALCGGLDEEQSLQVELNLQQVGDEYVIDVKNLETTPWQDCQLVINTIYKASVGSLAPGEEQRIPLTSFRTKLGIRLDPEFVDLTHLCCLVRDDKTRASCVPFR